MRVLVAYYSETMNTLKVAEAIHGEASKSHVSELKDVRSVDASTLGSYDLVFLGSTCHSMDLAAPAKRLLEEMPSKPGFKLAGFFTHATLKQEDDTFPAVVGMFERWTSKAVDSFKLACAEKGVGYLGYFNCMGAPSPGIMELIRDKVIEGEELWNWYVEEAPLHPSEGDLMDAREFTRGVLDSCLNPDS